MALPKTSRIDCPRCAVAAISPETGKCDVCGYQLDIAPAGERGEGRTDALADLVARQLAHEFEIGEIIGRREGSMVLRAADRKDAQRVVVKVVQRRADDPGSEVRFRSTMDAHAHLDHPNLIPVLRYGVTESLLWYSMQDHGSTSLRAQLREQGRLDTRATRRIATQLVGALEYLHRRGIVHGAVKPENVLVDAQGWVRLVEPAFATATSARRRPSGPQHAVSEDAPRPSWVAPEDVGRAERTPSSDQFSLAALLFECVSGEPPLEPGEQVARFRPDVPQAMSQALARALDAQASHRFASCSDFLFALEHNAPALAAPTRPSGRMSTEALLIHDWEPPEEAARTAVRPATLVIGAVLLVGLGVAIPPLVTKFQESRTPPSMISAPETALLPSGPATAAPPSAVRVTGEIPDPATTTPTPRQPAPSSTRSVAPRSTASAPASTPPASTTTLPPAATPTPSAAAASVGKLTVNASPWGQVFIGDRLIGNTPRADIELPAGQHTLRVSRDGFQTVTRTVQIRAGETLRITDIVLVPIAP